MGQDDVVLEARVMGWAGVVVGKVGEFSKATHPTADKV